MMQEGGEREWNRSEYGQILSPPGQGPGLLCQLLQPRVRQQQSQVEDEKFNNQLRRALQ